MRSGVEVENWWTRGRVGGTDVHSKFPASIGLDLEKPIRPEKYQLLIGLTGEFQIWWIHGAADSRTNERRVGPTERDTYRTTTRDCRAVTLHVFISCM
jgi:hypothetical protein